MKIMIAADGSDYTIKAINHVVTHLDWFQGEPELHLLHVKQPIPPGRARAFLAGDEINDYYREDSEAALAPAENLLKTREIAFRSAWKAGDIAEEIRSYATTNKIDMIVMGSHGHGALQNLVMGSVATKVLAATTVPVLIVR